MKAGLLLAAALLALGGPASGRSRYGVALADPIWLVVPATDEGRELSVAQGEWVTRTTLLPAGLAQLEEDAVGADGLLVYPKGEKLMLREIGNGTGWCTILARKLGPNGRGEPGSLHEEICFLDGDGDGRLDTNVRVRGLPATGLFGAALPHKSSSSIRPVGIRHLAPEQTDAPFVVGVKYSGVYLGGTPHFTVYFGQAGADQPVGGSMKLARDGRIDLLGASYRVLSRDKQAIHVRVEKAIPAQRFQVSAGVF
jgi:hypothetical protein